MKCRLDLGGKWKEISPEFCEMLGYQQEKLEKLRLTDVVHEKDQGKVSDFFDRIKEEDCPEWEAETKLITKNGTSFPVYLTLTLIRDTEGKPKAILCYIHNLSREKELQQKLQTSKQQFESLFNHNPLPVYCYDLKGNFRDANEKLAEFTGLSRDELIGMNFDQFIEGEDLKRAKEQFQKAIKGKAGTYEIEVVVQGGIKKDIRVTKFPMYMGDEITGVYGIFEDITEQKKAQRKLKESHQRWQQLVEYNPQPVLIIQEGNIVFINKVGAEYFKVSSAKEVIGKSMNSFSEVDSWEEAKNRMYQLEQNEQVAPHQYSIVLSDGEKRHIETHSIPITYKGKPAIQTVIHDISELKEKQHIIGKSLKEKETLLQEIHHRVKNNLAVISGLLELQQMNISDEETINALQDSQLRIQSMAMIHEKLYQSETLHEIGFDVYLQELISSINSTYNSSYKKVSTEYDLAQVMLDLDQAIPCSLIVNEVIVNCYKHAFDKNNEGKINISLTCKNPEIKLEITDNGKGLPSDFDISEQQSLGTTLINVLSRQLKGEMVLRNREKNKGTRFKLQFEKVNSGS